MDIAIKTSYLKKLASKYPDQQDKLKKLISFNSDEATITVSFHLFTEPMINDIEDWAEKDYKNKVEGAKVLLRRIRMFRKMKTEVKDLKVRKLVDLAEALKHLIAPLPHKYLFKADPDGHLVPYFVEEVKYFRGRRRDDPSYTQVSLVYIVRREKKESTIRFYKPDVRKKLTVLELLKSRDYYLETPDMVKAWTEDAEKYRNLSPKTGTMLLAVGTGFEVGGEDDSNRWWWNLGSVAMEREGIPTRVVMDDLVNLKETGIDSGDGNIFIDPEFWKGEATSIVKEDSRNMDFHDNSEDDEGDDDDEAEQEEQVVVPPIHPLVKVFDLTKHSFINIHIGNISEYKYTPEVFNKLILPSEKKNLIRTLVEGSQLIMEDIIKGKTGGIIVLATGAPGTGKTLTAEVYSEATAKPLYIVQCSQLGTEPSQVEKNLTKSLSRATRWNAILLIDEADVYIHERGMDMEQNAVVGVFLRVMEYYRGILFLTSNRETIIDDAVESRATAHVRYDLPSEEELIQIWQVQADQQQVKLEKGMIKKLAIKYPGIPGRSVKNILKLAKLISTKQGRTVDMDLFKFVTRFLDIQSAEQKKPNGNGSKK